MDELMTIPEGEQGYLLEEVELFLAAAHDQGEALRAAIAAAEARRAAAEVAAAAPDPREEIAAALIHAQGAADAVRAAADADAKVIIEQALADVRAAARR